MANTQANKKEKTYIFHSDPGHGWLAVKEKELIELNIAYKISPYSYHKGKTVYLEEDSDAGIFIEALKAKGIEFKYRSSYQEKTPIRSYPRYEAPDEPLQENEEDLYVS